jgi:biopolymer transport protein ExbB
MTPIFLQVTQTLTNNPVAPKAAPEAMSIFDMIAKGGLIMIPILILSVVAVGVFLERYFTIRKYVKSDVNFMNNIYDFIRNGKLDSAQTLCKNTNEPIARMIEKGISRIGKPIKEIEESVEIAGKFEVYNLEKNINILAIIASIAPMFGFLGTILGVIKIFYNISLTSDVSIGSISAGLYTKMVTSAAGLVVGILAYIGYHWLNRILQRAVHKLEWNAMNFLELLKEPSK